MLRAFQKSVQVGFSRLVDLKTSWGCFMSQLRIKLSIFSQWELMGCLWFSIITDRSCFFVQ